MFGIDIGFVIGCFAIGFIVAGIACLSIYHSYKKPRKHCVSAYMDKNTVDITASHDNLIATRTTSVRLSSSSR